MHLALSIAPLLLAALTSGTRIRLMPNAGQDCNGKSLPSDSSNAGGTVDACFNLSEAESFQWTKSSKVASEDTWAKFIYYSETDCSGDVTAVKSLCGVGTGGGTCYNKHDPNAGSVNVKTPTNNNCEFWLEGELECHPQDTGVLDPTCSGDRPDFPRD
jgi:hypothetical protein